MSSSCMRIAFVLVSSCLAVGEYQLEDVFTVPIKNPVARPQGIIKLKSVFPATESNTRANADL